MKIKIFCRCSLFPSWSGQGLISTPVFQCKLFINYTLLHKFVKEIKTNRNSHSTLNTFTSNLETLRVFIGAQMYFNGPIDF
jgi:hypothetical protein